MSTAIFTRDFLRSVASLRVEDQKRCFQAVYWFEHHCPPHDRGSRSTPIELSPKRRIRSTNASKTLRVLYETVERNVRHWLWAGEEWELENVIATLDETKKEDEELETLDCKTLLAWLKDAILETEEASTAATKTTSSSENGTGHFIQAPSPVALISFGSEVDKLMEAADAVSLFVAEGHAAWEHVKDRLVDQAPVAPPVQAHEPEEDESDEKVSPERFKELLENFNAIRAERDRLQEDLKIEKKRTNLEKLEASRALERMSNEETRIAQDRVKRLENQLAVIRASAPSLNEEAKQKIKDECSKLVEIHASKLVATEIPSLEEVGQKLYDVAVKIRALKV